jgi:hypothetical protein
MAVSLATPPYYRIRQFWHAAFISLETVQTATCNKRIPVLHASILLVLAQADGRYTQEDGMGWHLRGIM